MRVLVTVLILLLACSLIVFTVLPIVNSLKRRIFIKRSTILELADRPTLINFVSLNDGRYGPDVRPDVTEWLRLNAGKYQVLEINDRPVICFIDPLDAFAFKMRWF